MSLNIRQQLPSDVAAIHDLTRAAFLDATHTAHTEQYIVDALRKAGALPISLVAEQAGEIVGHVAISPVSISDSSADWYGLGPISVRPELQRKGIGSLLMQAALGRLRERGSAGCVLVGDPSYYSRFGFKAEASLVLADVPPEYFQALPFGPSLPSGIVTFHEAFRAAGLKMTWRPSGNAARRRKGEDRNPCVTINQRYQVRCRVDNGIERQRKEVSMLQQSHIVGFTATSKPDEARTNYGDVLGLDLIEETPFAVVFGSKRGWPGCPIATRRRT